MPHGWCDVVYKVYTINRDTEFADLLFLTVLKGSACPPAGMDGSSPIGVEKHESSASAWRIVTRSLPPEKAVDGLTTLIDASDLQAKHKRTTVKGSTQQRAHEYCTYACRAYEDRAHACRAHVVCRYCIVPLHAYSSAVSSPSAATVHL